MYLGLEVVVSHVGTSYPRGATLDTDDAFHSLRTGLSPFVALLSRRLLHDWFRSRVVRPKTPHVRPSFKGRIRFALCGFQSPLLAASQLISFPPGTETFHFPGLLLLAERVAKSHSVISGSTITCISPELIAACHVLLQLSSQVIHHILL